MPFQTMATETVHAAVPVCAAHLFHFDIVIGFMAVEWFAHFVVVVDGGGKFTEAGKYESIAGSFGFRWKYAAREFCRLVGLRMGHGF